MFKSKSFDLNTEENTKRTEHLYQPRRIRWMKYILIPVGIGFILLLILCNVDFSADQPPINTSIMQSVKWCTTNYNCDKNVSNLANKDHLLLRYENFHFPEGIISRELLTTEYSLQGLTLINCSVNYIMDGVFNQTKLHNLLEIELINTKLKNLTKSTFQGLRQLRNFTLINVRKSMHCESFMSPLASTLSSATIHQRYSGHSIYRPNDFFGTAIYVNLKSLDLKGNHFGDTLETAWFNNMPDLKSLNLADCRFDSIDFDTSTKSFAKLKYLDLRGNRLLRLNAQFISNAWDKGIQLKLTKHSYTASKTTTKLPIAIDVLNRDLGLQEDSSETPRYEEQSSRSTTKTTTVANITDPLPDTETTPIYEDIVTPPSSDLMNIMCLNTAKDNVSNLSMSCNGEIRILDQTESTVHVVLSNVVFTNWALVYFANQSDTNCVESSGDTSIAVKNLSCATSYVFCLLEGNKTSPVNCQSHRTLACPIFIVSKTSWFEENSVLIVSLGIVGILVFVAIGGVIMFAILWHRPTWLCGSNRLKRAARDSLTMLLLPPNYENNLYTSAIRKENGGDDYMTYYRHLEQTQLNDTESNKYNIPPQESAPPAPNPKGHTYESFDLYEELI